MTTENKLLVSVIIPMYNAAQFIPQTLESLLNQTIKNFEVVIVDDCSTDNSLEVVESFKPQFDSEGIKLTVIKMPQNTGMPGLPRNTGIKSAQGKYVCFLDSDDLYTSTALEELSTLAEEYQADVVHCNDSFSAFKGKPLPADDPHITDTDYILDPENLVRSNWQWVLSPQPPAQLPAPTLKPGNLEERVRNWVNWKYRLGVCSVFCRRDFLMDNQIFFPNLIVSEDQIFLFKCLCFAKNFLCVPNIACIIRPRIDSINSDKNLDTNSEEYINKWLHVVNDGFNELDKFMDTLPFFQKNLKHKLAVLNFFFTFNIVINKRLTYSPNQVANIFPILQRFFHPDNATLTAYLLNIVKDYHARLSADDGERKALSIRSGLMAIENKILVSVIIPMYNAEKFIPQTLESLLYQTMTDFEVIVVDDCSTDNSVEVVKSYAEKFGGRLHVLKLPENSGTPGLPRNKGINFARGKYIAFLDSDDLFTKTALEELTTLAEEYKADVVHTSGAYILWKDYPISINNPAMTDMNELTNPKNYSFMSYKRSETPPPDKPVLDTKDPVERLNRWLKWEYDWSTCTTFCRREFLMENDIHYSAMKTSEDVTFGFECFFHSENYLTIPNVTYIIRPREGSISRDWTRIEFKDHVYKRTRALIDGFKEFERVMDKIDFFKENPDYRYAMLEWFADFRLPVTMRFYKKRTAAELNEMLKEVFGSDDAAMFAYLFNKVNLYRRRLEELEKKLEEPKQNQQN